MTLILVRQAGTLFSSASNGCFEARSKAKIQVELPPFSQ
jgi:hypothetical protein